MSKDKYLSPILCRINVPAVSIKIKRKKVKRARKFGTQVIDQAEMMMFIKSGNFPSARL